MENSAWLDWLALLVLLVLAGLIARNFTRRTYRISVIVTTLASLVALAVYGGSLEKHNDFVDNFYAGGKDVIKTMINPIAPVDNHALPIGIAWGILAVLCFSVLILFDTWSVRREQPRVEIPEAPKVENGDVTLEDRFHLTEELRFRLPAVYVRGPATMPGGDTLDTVATIVEESGAQYGKFAAALMHLVHALQGNPRTYQTRCYPQRCNAEGRLDDTGDYRRVTVDMQNARTGQSITAHVLPPCHSDETSEQVAGFAARQVFRSDPSTPEWAVGSHDGQDLAAYLLSQEIHSAGPTFAQLKESREKKRAKLEDTANIGAASGVIGNQLAAMCDMDGDYSRSLLLHLQNRLNYPAFQAGRYRLAISMKTLAWKISETDVESAMRDISRELGATGSRERVADIEELARLLTNAELIRRLSPNEQMILRNDLPKILKHAPKILKQDAKTLKGGLKILKHAPGNMPAHAVRIDTGKALLHLAMLELRAYRHSSGTLQVIWSAFWRRDIRSSLLQSLLGNGELLHPRRRRLAPYIATEIAAQRRNLLARKMECSGRINFRLWLAASGFVLTEIWDSWNPDVALQQAKRWALRRIGAKDVLTRGKGFLRSKPFTSGNWATPKRPITKVAKRVPWQATYNAACLFAVCEHDAHPSDEDVSIAVDLLRHAVGSRECDLERPSEWIGMDPGLQPLRGTDEFDNYVSELAAKDFRAGPPPPESDEWFMERLRVAGRIVLLHISPRTLRMDRTSASHTVNSRFCARNRHHG